MGRGKKQAISRFIGGFIPSGLAENARIAERHLRSVRPAAYGDNRHGDGTRGKYRENPSSELKCAMKSHYNI